MADLISRDAVNEIKSVGDHSPADVSVTTSNTADPSRETQPQSSTESVQENGVVHVSQASATEEQVHDDTASRSDTDSRADGSITDSKTSESKLVVKPTVNKPVSFAKYSVPKVIAAASKIAADKSTTSTTSTLSIPSAGRPRLVAKTTSALQQKAKPGFKAAAPDPMQVWNKNRVTPQPSTKNLTDEELKQQYGIHLTSRIQSDGDGKEAKWADIDDDEDDWAPETIEWGDGTKTTVGAEPVPTVQSAAASKPSTPAIEVPKAVLEAKLPASVPSSIGPNATVLKVGASAERQQAQKTIQQTKGHNEKTSQSASNTNPAPPPVKSPWAKLPPVDKVPPIEINPQPGMPPPLNRYPSGVYPASTLSNASPAREISADDFNRTWRDSNASSQNQSLFMPGSGRYEPVPENRRRMSRNDGFRAPAVLQRPSNDARAPEPSSAFQTNRTSTDAIRRRASSTISGDSGQFVRRMSIKPADVSSEAVIVEDDPPTINTQNQIHDPQPTAYQVRGQNPTSTPGLGQTDAELEAQRAQQRDLMKEQAELARKRRKEEEERLEAEKRERIRQKLASLGPDPKVLKAEEEARAKAEAEKRTEEAAMENAPEDADVTTKSSSEKEKTSAVPQISALPPKPPQPHATGEPQQYGMMKVHALDTVKQTSPLAVQYPQPAKPLPNVQSSQSMLEDISPEPPMTNGVSMPTSSSARQTNEADRTPEPITRTNRPVSEVRASWGRNNHPTQQTSNMWGLPNNRTLGNGTFDQTLAGYAPQDLSSRASSTGQVWLNGRTPTVGQSPQLGHANHHVPETRSQALQNMTSPETLPLSLNSEADSMLPVRPPAPIGPPQSHAQFHQSMANGHVPTPASHSNVALAGWNNFHNVARGQERALYEQQQRETATRKEEAKQTGIHAQANYNLQESFKQVHADDSTQQQQQQQQQLRQVNNVAHINLPPANMFGAIGPASQGIVGPQNTRGSRFFPQTNGVSAYPDKRAVTYSHSSTPRSPSPPAPAEDYVLSHPAYEFAIGRPVIKLPPEKVVVKLPPAIPLSTPEPIPPPREPTPPPSTQPMTWAARAAMPPPKPQPPIRAVSTPIVQNPSWQERFNGLLNNAASRNSSDVRADLHHPLPAKSTSVVNPMSRELFEVTPSARAAVSLPASRTAPVTMDAVDYAEKNVEDEEDLFEDREAGSLPSYKFPTDAPALIWPRPQTARVMPTPPDIQSAHSYMINGWKVEKLVRPQFAIIRVPGNEQSVKKDIPSKSANGVSRPQTRYSSGSFKRNHRGGKPRPAQMKT